MLSHLSWPEVADAAPISPWFVADIPISLAIAAVQGQAMPLECRNTHDVAENDQELVHGNTPLKAIRLPLALALKRV